jgi:hypothetical protein
VIKDTPSNIQVRHPVIMHVADSEEEAKRQGAETEKQKNRYG